MITYAYWRAWFWLSPSCNINSVLSFRTGDAFLWTCRRVRTTSALQNLPKLMELLNFQGHLNIVLFCIYFKHAVTQAVWSVWKHLSQVRQKLYPFANVNIINVMLSWNNFIEAVCHICMQYMCKYIDENQCFYSDFKFFCLVFIFWLLAQQTMFLSLCMKNR